MKKSYRQDLIIDWFSGLIMTRNLQSPIKSTSNIFPASYPVRNKSDHFRITKVLLYWIVFIIIQIVITYLFVHAGRDNEEYTRIFEEVGSSYLEPFWIFYYWIITEVKIIDYVDPTYGIFLLSIFAASLFFGVAIKRAPRPFSVVLIIIAIMAYQVSLVTGALRQGVSFFFFATYLLSISERHLLLAAITHLSGLVYLVFSRYLLAIIILISIGFWYGYDWSNIDFLSSATQRYVGYILSGESLDLRAILLFVSLKLVAFFIFLLNFKFLKRCIRLKPLLYMLLLTPVVQMVIYILIPNPIITDRVNLILDPFVLVGLVVLAGNINSVNVVAITLLTVPKLVARLYLALT